MKCMYLVLAAFLITSCGSNDNPVESGSEPTTPPPPQPTPAESIVGTWTYRGNNYMDTINSNIDGLVREGIQTPEGPFTVEFGDLFKQTFAEIVDSFNARLTFNQDGTATFSEPDGTSPVPITWQTSGSMITIKDPESEATFGYRLAGNELILRVTIAQLRIFIEYDEFEPWLKLLTDRILAGISICEFTYGRA